MCLISSLRKISSPGVSSGQLSDTSCCNMCCFSLELHTSLSMAATSLGSVTGVVVPIVEPPWRVTDWSDMLKTQTNIIVDVGSTTATETSLLAAPTSQTLPTASSSKSAVMCITLQGGTSTVPDTCTGWATESGLLSEGVSSVISDPIPQVEYTIAHIYHGLLGLQKSTPKMASEVRGLTTTKVLQVSWGERYDSSSNVTATASSTVAGCFCHTEKESCGHGSWSKYAFIANHSRVSSCISG